MKRVKSWIRNYKKRILENKSSVIIFLLIFALFIFLRFYQIEERNLFGFDQVDYAWAAKNIIVEHKFPLMGTQAKLNSGIFIGPLYYYYIALFYFITNLDPIASGIAAGFTSVITFFVIYFVTKNLFSKGTAFIALFLYTVSYATISADRVEWPVGFIFPVSLIIFYSLYKIIIDEPKYILPLVFFVGVSFSAHFTAVFYPFIILMSLPLFPKKKETLKYIGYSIPVALIIFSPILIYLFHDNGFLGKSSTSYIGTYYHGLHLRRVLQLTRDAFIQFEQLLYFPQIKHLSLIGLPLFALIYLKDKFTKEKLFFVYLCALWFFVPWIIFSLYSGEISDYYFLISRPIVLLILSYFIYRLLMHPLVSIRGLVLFILIGYSIVNLNEFLMTKRGSLIGHRQTVLAKIKNKEKIQFKQGAPESYLYYIYRERYEK